MNDSSYEGVIAVRGKHHTGFVSIADNDEDVVVMPSSLHTALDGDVVRIELLPPVPGRRREGRVVAVITRKRDELIGTVVKEEGAFHLAPDERHVHIRPQVTDGHKHSGMKVAARLRWDSPHTEPVVELVDVLGPAGAHETEMQAIVRRGGFAAHFPPQVSHAAHALYEKKDEIFAAAVADTQKEGGARTDMRTVTTFTIDPKDAKDFDDALSFRRIDNGTVEVGIHIADVSHYVAEGDAIDQEARERGTSVYLVDRVIPMLPEVLSNDLCSLRPNQDRLAFSAVFTLSADGDVKEEWYGQTIIHSDRRFTYQEAQDILERGAGDYHQELSALMAHARVLRTARHKEGAIAFEQPEVQFELDEQGAPVGIYAKERTETMLMVEDYMLLANRKVAEYINARAKEKSADMAFVYRVHDTPDTEKIEALSIFLRALGYELETHKGMVHSRAINKLLKEVEGTPEEYLIKTATIRSMAKAVYSTKNIGHFGLAFRYYTHFTSPIRRYPDLMAHRLLRKHLDGTPVGGDERARYERLSVQSSQRELGAVSAERDSIKYKQVEYMEQHVGETFTGIITGTSDWGLYVEEKHTKAEGMVRLADISGDYFEHDKSKYHVKGERTGATFRLGDEVRVRLVRADRAARQIDFELVNAATSPSETDGAEARTTS